MTEPTAVVSIGLVKLSLTVEGDLLGLEPGDRRRVFALVDRWREMAQPRKPAGRPRKAKAEQETA